MKLHFGQPKSMRCGQKAEDKVPLPAWAPPAWKIDQWKKQKPEIDRRPQPTVEIDEVPPGYKPSGEGEQKKDDIERGVVILEFK